MDLNYFTDIKFGNDIQTNAIYNIFSGEYTYSANINEFLDVYTMKNVINRYNKLICSFGI